MQCRPDLFYVACEDLCYESLSVRDFARCRYCVPVACKAQELVRDDNGLCYANANQWASPDTKKPLGPAPLRIGWRVAMGPLNPGPHDGYGRAGAGGGTKASVRESQKLLPGRQTYSRLHKSALLQHHKGGLMHIQLMQYNHK